MGIAGRDEVGDQLKLAQVTGTPDITPDAVAAEAEEAGVAGVERPMCTGGRPAGRRRRTADVLCSVWVTGTALATALNTSFFAQPVGLFAIVVGIALLLTGIGFLVLTLGLGHWEAGPGSGARTRGAGQASAA